MRPKSLILDSLLGNTHTVVLADLSGAGQKNRTMDAMSHGCYVVGLPEVFRGINNDQETPAFMVAETVAELLSKLEQLDTASMAAIAAAGQALIRKNYSAQNLCHRWQELLNSVPPLRLAD